MQGSVPGSSLLVPLLGDVAGEPHRRTRLDRGDARGLDLLQGGGDVLLGGLADHEVRALDPVAVVERGLRARVMGQDHEVHDASRVTGPELLRRHLSDAVEGLVLVPVLPHKALGRGTQVDGQHPVHVSHDGLMDGLGVLSGCHSRTQAQSPATQDGGQGAVHRVRGGGGEGVRHGVVRHRTVLRDQACQLGPVTAVPDGGLKGSGHTAVHEVRTGLGVSHGVGEEGVGLLQLVMEVDEGLAELEGLQVQLLDHRGAQHVEPGEGPAAAGVLLVRDRGVRDEVRDGGVDGGQDLAVQAQLLDVRGGDGVADHAGGTV